VSDPQRTAWPQRHYFLLRRLHSLAGLLPVGVFLTFHLTINSTIVAGPEKFQTAVDGIHLLDKVGLLYAVEIVGIFLPLLFHAALGVQIWLSSTPTAATYRFGGNVRYTLQRVTGVIALVFILFHLWQMHWTGRPFGGGFFDPHDAPGSAARAMAAWFYTPLYGIGILASVFHLANGIWTALITWGVTIGPKAQRTSGWVCTAFGLALGLVGLGALRGFRTLEAPAELPLVHAVQVEQPAP